MGALEEAFEGGLQVAVPLVGQGLGENAEDRLVGLGAGVVACLKHHWLSLVAA